MRMGTQTYVTSPGKQKIQRSTAMGAEHLSLCGVMLFTQMTLYGSLAVLPEAGSASWRNIL